MEQEVGRNISELISIQNRNRRRPYDLFISYRRIPRPDNDHQITEDNDLYFSTSVTRAIALEYNLQGYRVFIDTGSSEDDYQEALKNSRNYIVLLAEYSFKEGGGGKYRQELSYILDIMKYQKMSEENLKRELEKYDNKNEDKKKNITLLWNEIKKKKIYWMDIDGRFRRFLKLVNQKGMALDDDGNPIKSCYSEEEIKRLSEDNDFRRIQEAITQIQETEPKNNPFVSLQNINTADKNFSNNLPKIKKCPRISFRRAKWMSGVFGVLLLAAFVVLGVLIYRITRPDIIFVGGGTVKNYLDNMALSNGETIEDITRWFPNSKYIHIPSEDAIPVLLDIRNDSTAGSYTPIVFSAGRMIINKDAEIKFMNEERRRIFELPIGKADLLVQIYDTSGHYRDSNTITVNTLRNLLLDSNNTVYTTSERSGTLNQYNYYLKDSSFACPDSIKGIRKFFNPDDADSIFIAKSKGIRIILGNEYYFFKGKCNDASSWKKLSVVDKDNKTVCSLPLFVYAASEVNNGSGNFLMNRNVYKVLHFIDDRVQNNGDETGNNGIFIQLP